MKCFMNIISLLKRYVPASFQRNDVNTINVRNYFMGIYKLLIPKSEVL